MKRQLLAMMFFLSAAAVHAEEFSSFVWQRTGLDAEGTSAEERIELRAVGGAPTLALWKTPGRGGFCPTSGGQFSAPVSPTDTAEGMRLAQALVNEQKDNDLPVQSSVREVRSSLQVIAAGKAASAELVFNSPAHQAFEKFRVSLFKAMKPVSAVAVSAHAHGSSIELKFSHQGEFPFRLVLPEAAAEAFSADGAKLTYARKPGKHDVVLNRSHPSLTVVLKASGKVEYLRFSNALIRHHGKRGKDAGTALPLNLCAKVGPASH